MRRSFGGNQGMSGGNGGMIRTVHRAVKAAGVGGSSQDPFSHSTANTSANRPTYRPTTASNILSLTSPSSSSSLTSFNVPISATSTLPNWPASPTYSDDFDWEYIDGIEDERARGYFDDSILASVPTRDEVQLAISSLHHVIDPASLSQYVKDMLPRCSDSDSVDDQLIEPTGFMQSRSSSGRSGSDWIEPPSIQLFNQGAIHHGFNGVYDAFNLLQTEPIVQRMVISLSSDRAVWDAVLNNEVVRELKESFNQDGKDSSSEGQNGSSDGDEGAVNILGLIFNNTKEKVSELFEGIWKMFAELFRQPDKEKAFTDEVDDLFQERLRSSFFLSILVMLIVVVTRAQS
ncbi:uncharacterized protein LOC124937449 [Impatiens glandulifera]|uniref:uncharacterized protein LOC124937449 n=1 Tax=Impatiens glandulifera TaxID=253017 RepID=UPI001FB074CF|nr:uncharacterized protein LOC124937449 [Impatiens glandulifera]